MDSFSTNAKAYKTQLLKVDKTESDATSYSIGPDNPNSNYDRLVKFVSGGEFQNDFLLLLGKYQLYPSCGGMDDGDLPGLAGWSFVRVRRNVKVEAVLVHNLSAKRLVIGQFFGERDAVTNLRVAAPAFELPANSGPLEGTSDSIAPGQTAIILTRILFLLPSDQLSDFRKYRESMDALHNAFGSGDFAGNISAYKAPDPKDYAFGPALSLTGALVNSTRVEFSARRVPNFLEMTVSQEGASC